MWMTLVRLHEHPRQRAGSGRRTAPPPPPVILPRNLGPLPQRCTPLASSTKVSCTMPSLHLPPLSRSRFESPPSVIPRPARPRDPFRRYPSIALGRRRRRRMHRRRLVDQGRRWLSQSTLSTKLGRQRHTPSRSDSSQCRGMATAVAVVLQRHFTPEAPRSQRQPPSITWGPSQCYGMSLPQPLK